METYHTSVVRNDTNMQHSELPMNRVPYKITNNDNTICNAPYYPLVVVGLQVIWAWHEEHWGYQQVLLM